MKIVKSIKFEKDKDPKVLEITNALAKLEKRKPLDAVRQLILTYGPVRIMELEKNG